jgi:hypothetical protein
LTDYFGTINSNWISEDVSLPRVDKADSPSISLNTPSLSDESLGNHPSLQFEQDNDAFFMFTNGTLVAIPHFPQVKRTALISAISANTPLIRVREGLVHGAQETSRL